MISEVVLDYFRVKVVTFRSAEHPSMGLHVKSSPHNQIICGVAND
jgi:hypothetical protein